MYIAYYNDKKPSKFPADFYKNFIEILHMIFNFYNFFNCYF